MLSQLDEVLHRAQAGGGGCVKVMDKQKEKMKQRLLYGPPDQEGEDGEEEDPPESDDSVSEISVKSDYNVIHDVISDEEAEREKTFKLRLTPTSKAKAIDKSKESKAKEKKNPRPPLPRLRKEEKKEKKEKEDERPPSERRVPAKGKGKGSVASARPALSEGTSKGKDKNSAVPARQLFTPRAEGYEGDDSEEESPAKPMSSRPSKSARSDDLIGFTPGAVAVFSQNLVFQRLEEIKQLENACAVLAENNPAKKHLRETINHLKKEVEDLKAEKAKSKPAQGRKHSARQESDKKVAGNRVAYIQEKQRRRAAKARAEGVKERAQRRLANEEAYENEFNQEGRGRKRQTYPLSTGRFAEDKEAAPLTKEEKSFRKEEGDEDLEVKERSMKLPECEIKRQKTKRQREKERKQRRAEEERAKEAEKKRKREEEAQEHEDEEKPKKDKKKNKKKKEERKEREKEKEEERSKARGSAASARQSSSFNPSKGRMGGSTSEDEEKGELHRLEAPEKVPPQGENWTRVDLIVDSGASDSTLPIGVLPGHQIGDVRGYTEFSMADGRILPNLRTKKLQMAFQCGRVMTGTFSVGDTSKPLLSVGKLISMGHKVEMNPDGKGWIKLKNGGKITIYLRNGVWKLPVCIWDPFQRQDK